LLLAAVRVLDRQDNDERVGEEVVDDAVVPRGEVVEGCERGVGGALLITVDVARKPEDDWRRRQRGVDVVLARERVPERRDGGLDGGDAAPRERRTVAHQLA